MVAPVRLSVVIPAYNESHRLGGSLRSIRHYAQERWRGGAIEVIVVDDGSTDSTAEVVRRFEQGPLELKLLVSDSNRGKGHSVRRGMLEATGDVLLMCDADLSTPIEEIEKMLPLFDPGVGPGAEAEARPGGPGVVIGSRAMPGAVLDPPQGPLRHLIHHAFRAIRRRIMLPDILDTQCGFKAFTRQAAREIFPLQRAAGYAFDCEVLGLASALGLGIREVGVVWRNDPRSAVRLFRDGPAVLWSLLKIRRRLKKEFSRS